MLFLNIFQVSMNSQCGSNSKSFSREEIRNAASSELKYEGSFAYYLQVIDPLTEQNNILHKLSTVVYTHWEWEGNSN